MRAAAEGSQFQVLQGRVQRACSAADKLPMRELITWGDPGAGLGFLLNELKSPGLSRS